MVTTITKIEKMKKNNIFIGLLTLLIVNIIGMKVSFAHEESINKNKIGDNRK